MPVDPRTISAIASAVPSVYQLGAGIVQGIRANRLGKKKRPQYVIPNEINQNVGLAQGAYNAASMYGLPGQGRIQNNLLQSQAAGMQGIAQSQQSPAAQLLGYSSLNQNTNNALANVGVQAANFRQSNMMNTMQGLMSAKQALAAYRDKEFEMNQLRPFQDAMAASGALRAGSMQNVYGAIGGLANTAANYINRPPQDGATTQGLEKIIATLRNAGVDETEITNLLQQYGK